MPYVYASDLPAPSTVTLIQDAAFPTMTIVTPALVTPSTEGAVASAAQDDTIGYQTLSATTWGSAAVAAVVPNQDNQQAIASVNRLMTPPRSTKVIDLRS